MVYERARTWLEGKSIPTREQAELFLANNGEDSNRNPWTSVLDAIYPEAEITTITPEFAIGEQQQKELQQQKDLNFIERAGRFVRRLLRGEVQQI